MTAILTIAVGIAATATIFALVNQILLRPLPYADPDRLVWISTWHPQDGRYSKSSGFDYHVWVERTTLFESVEAYWDTAYTLTGTDRPEALVGWQLTPTLMATLGVRPALGRTFVAGDGDPGRDTVVILSDALWRRRFAARADVVGSTVDIDGRAYTIAGVMPPTFTHPYAGTQLWTPFVIPTALQEDRRQRPLRVLARLKPGVTRERAEAELQATAQQLAQQFPDTHAGWTTRVRPLRDFYVGDTAQLLWILQGTALILLLIAASNVASLVLVRAIGREKELSVRLALGASRRHLLRQHLTEGFTLAAAGVGAGLGLALWGVQILPGLLATRLQGLALPDSPLAWVDARVLLASAAATIAIGLLFGLTPLLRRADGLARALHASGRGATGDRRARLLRRAIVTLQVALSVTLLVGAGLLVRSFARLQDRSFGFDTDGVMTALLQLPRDRYATPAQTTAFLEQLVTGLAALPGVDGAAAINTLPLTGRNALRPHNLPGQPREDRLAEFRIVTPDYFRTMRIPLTRGRVFDARDRAGAADVVVVNETLARRLWPNAEPLGQTLMVADFGTPSAKTVIGVVGDTRHHDLAKDPEPEIYRSAYQTYWPFFGVVVRTSTAPALLERPMRDVAARVDRGVPLSDFRPFSALASTTWAWRRSSMALLAAFAGAAGFLAFVGVYGVMAYSVTARSREIGVRLALGARPADVARAVVTQGLGMTGLGVGLGLAMAAALAGLLSALLFGVAPLDPATFALVALGALATGVAASAMPALMASRTDPVIALRGE